MGALFSSDEPRQQYVTETESYDLSMNNILTELNRLRINTPVQRNQIDEDEANRTRRIDWNRQPVSVNPVREVQRETIRTPPVEQVTRNYYLLGLHREIYENSFQLVTYTLLNEYDNDYVNLMTLITNKKSFKVDGIHRVNNPYLKKSYEFKKEEKKLQYGNMLTERLLFHGTKSANIDNICKYNFNWRLHGSGTGHKFGQGVSFSPNAIYASNYSDKNSYKKVMLVASVLIGPTCPGNENMILPDFGCDTALKGDGIVVVKFEDCEFYPAFKIEYHLTAQAQRRPVRNRARKINSCDFNNYVY